MKSARSAQKEKLQQQLSDSGKNNYRNPDDELFWKPERDESGNGEFIIRFLPAPAGEDTAQIKIWDHGFQGPSGKWYIEKSLRTIGQDDPVNSVAA